MINATPLEKLRVLVLLPTITKSGGGVSEAARLLTAEWAKRQDAEIEIVTVLKPGFEEALEQWPNVPVHAFKRKGVGRFGISVGMLRFLQGHDYDVAHVHGVWTVHCYAALRWSRRFKRPYLVTPHGMLEAWIMNRSKLLKKIVSVVYHTRFLKQASLFHALTPKETEDIRAVLPSASIIEVPNFVPKLKPTSEHPNWWQNEFSERRVVLFFGRIHDKKGWKELFEAWDSMCAEHPSFQTGYQLVFCGWLDAAEGFEAEAKRLNSLYGNVLYAGPQYGEDKHRSYSAADLFILPSKSEGLPMSVLESWAAECPVMMTDACNLPRGFEADAAIRIGQSAEAILTALRKLSETPDERLQELSANGTQLLENHYSPESCATKLWDAMRALVSPTQRS